MDIISERWRWFRRGKRRVFAVSAVVGLITGIAGLGMLSIPAGAAGVADIFELEGDTADAVVDPDLPEDWVAPWDWTTFFDQDGERILPLKPGFIDSAFDADAEFPDTSTFTSGSKDTLDVSGWSCTSSNNLGGKFDIVNAYSAIYEVPATAGSYTKGDKLLFFGIERAATEGDGNMGFWFLKNDTNCNKTEGGKAPAFPGSHADGDVFVVAGFSNGGTNATVTAYEWEGGADGALAATPFVNATQTCTSASVSLDACGVVNAAPIATDDGKPWPSLDKNGGDLDVNAFYEGFVKVPAAQAGGCFSTFVANTRSSTSPTATIMDFSRGSFPTCAPSTLLAASAATTGSSATPPQLYSGGSATFTFTEQNDGNVALSNVSVTADNGCSPVGTPQTGETYNVGDVNDNNKLDPGETWIFTCTVNNITADLTVTGTGHGFDPLGRDVTFVTGCTSNATRFCDASEVASASVDVIAPSTTMLTTAATANPTIVHASDNVTFVFYEKNDGDVALGTPTVSADNGCSPAEVKKKDNETTNIDESLYNVGDADNDGVFDIHETWVFTCTTSFGTAGSKTVTAIGHATDPLGNDISFRTGCTAGTVTNGVLCDLQETTSASVTVINPNLSLTKTASALVTYTFIHTNDGDAEMTNPTVVDDKCTPAETKKVDDPSTGSVNEALYNIGDTDNDGKLDVSESWTYTCQQTITGATPNQPIVNTAVGSATDAAGSTVTYCTDPTSPPLGTICDQDVRDRASVEVKHL